MDQIFQIDLGTSQVVNSYKCLIAAHQSCTRADTANKNNNIAKFDKINLQKYYVEIDGQRYPQDSVVVNFEQNDYIEQYKDLELFFREYVGEPILNPLISYPDMKTKYSIGIINLRHHPDHITPKKFQFFHEYVADLENARLSLILIRRTEIELILDGNKLIEVKVV